MQAVGSKFVIAFGLIFLVAFHSYTLRSLARLELTVDLFSS
jgi:hypothetical protein